MSTSFADSRPSTSSWLTARRPSRVTRQCDVRTVLSDNRFSRAQFHMRTACAGSDLPLALVTSDPPIHTVRRRAIQGWFTTRRAEQARPLIERVADQLINDLLAAGPPADIYARFCQPFPTSYT